MCTTFYIAARLQSDGWPEPYARFYLGNDKMFALQVFRQLKGVTDAKGNDLLQLDLVESADCIPIVTDIISCSLQQLAENVKIITREIFKSYHFHGNV